MKVFIDFMFYSLLDLKDAEKFEAWRKARNKYFELKRQNKDTEHAERLYKIACTAMHWNN